MVEEEYSERGVLYGIYNSNKKSDGMKININVGNILSVEETPDGIGVDLGRRIDGVNVPIIVKEDWVTICNHIQKSK